MSLRIVALPICLLALSLLPGRVVLAGNLNFQNPKAEPAELTEARELTESAVKLYNDGNYKEALTPAKRALEIREKSLPPDDERVIDAVANLAAIQAGLNNFGQAEELYKRVVRTTEKTGGAKSLYAADALDMLAWLHHLKGDPSQAEDDYKQELAIREKVTGPEGKGIARTLLKLAQLYQFEGELTKAEPLYQRLIAFDTKSFPDAKVLVSDALNAYSCLLRKMKKPEQAGELERRIEGPATTPKVPGKTEGVLNGKALRLPHPPYPLEARRSGVSGTVEVRVTISETGKVLHACAQSGHRLLWKVSESAAYTSEFAPTLLEGTPVKITGIITYNFVRQN
jgi:tetratricopeptide (TPR) repeat protein